MVLKLPAHHSECAVDEVMVDMNLQQSDEE